MKTNCLAVIAICFGLVVVPETSLSQSLETEDALASEWLGHPGGAAAADQWQFEFNPYIWWPTIDGTLRREGIGAPYDLAHSQFLDLVDELEGAFLGSVKARKGRVIFLADVIWMKFDDLTLGDLALSTPAPGLDMNLDWEQLLVQFGAGYTICESVSPDGNRMAIDLQGGGRYVYISGDGGIESPGDRIQIGLNGSENFFEPWIGTEVNYQLDECTNLVLSGDLGGFGSGESDGVNWQVAGKVQRFLTPRLSLDLGYRAVSLEYEDSYKGGTLRFEQEGHGPTFGITYRF